MVLVRPGGDWRVKKFVRQPKWSRGSPSVIVLESENGKQRDTASKESKAKEKESDRLRKKGCAQGESNGDSHDTSLTFWNSSDDRFAIFSTVPRPQHLAPTRYTWLRRIFTCKLPDILLRMRISSSLHIFNSCSGDSNYFLWILCTPSHNTLSI